LNDLPQYLHVCLDEPELLPELLLPEDLFSSLPKDKKIKNPKNNTDIRFFITLFILK
jgi:hypothetical protein